MLWADLSRDIVRTEVGSGEEAASFTLSVGSPSLPFTQMHLIARHSVRSTSGNIDVSIRLNTDSGTNYAYQNMASASGSAAAANDAAASSYKIHTVGATALKFGNGEALVTDAFATRGFKGIESIGANFESQVVLATGNWGSTAAVTSVTWVATGGGSFAEGSVFTLAVADEMFAVAGGQTVIT